MLPGGASVQADAELPGKHRRSIGAMLLLPGFALSARLPKAVRLGLQVACLTAVVAAGLFDRHAWALPVGLALLTAYLMITSWLDERQRGQQACRAMEALSAGQLTDPVPVRGHDELSAITRNVNAMAGNLRRTLARLARSATAVAHAGDKMSMSAQTLAIRSDEQAAVVTQTNLAIGDVLAAVQVNSDMACSVEAVSQQLCEQADSSKAVVSGAVTAIGRIKHSTQQMSDALGIIDTLTFQTNILALNAAVEAARAGEAGRGFAVVAAEVRALALRTAEAATEIKQMIERSNTEVAQGVTQVESLTSMIERVSDGFREVSSQMRDVSTNSLAQSAAISLISDGLGQVLALSRANNELVADSLQAAEGLRGSATELHELVATLGVAEAALPASDEQTQKPTPAPTGPTVSASTASVEFF